MNIKDNPVVNTGSMFLNMTIYFLVLFGAMELAMWLYAKYTPAIKDQAQKVAWGTKVRTRKAKRYVKEHIPTMQFRRKHAS